jgi:uncharacterized membrane protein
MTTLIAEAYKAIFALVAFVAVAVVVIVSIEAMRSGGVTPANLAMLAGGLVIVVLVMGAMALQIQNNTLLKQIARNTAPDAPAPVDRAAMFTPSADSAWPNRREPPVNRRP